MALFKKKAQAPETASPQDIRLIELLAHHGINCVFDIGANIGQTAQRYRSAGYKGRIVSFEPLSRNHALLENLAQADSGWEIAPRMAIGAHNETIDINISQNHDMSSLLNVNDAMLEALPKARIVETENVGVKTLDSIYDQFVHANERIFVKVDTQGFEKSVVEGAQTSIHNGKILGWQLEVSFFPLYSGEPTFEAITAYMKTLGYEAHFAMQGYFSKKLMRQLQMDLVFFRS